MTLKKWIETYVMILIKPGLWKLRILLFQNRAIALALIFLWLFIFGHDVLFTIQDTGEKWVFWFTSTNFRFNFFCLDCTFFWLWINAHSVGDFRIISKLFLISLAVIMILLRDWWTQSRLLSRIEIFLCLHRLCLFCIICCFGSRWIYLCFLGLVKALALISSTLCRTFIRLSHELHV